MDFALLSYLYRYFVGTNSHLYFFLGCRFMRFGFGSPPPPPPPRMRDFSEWSQCLVMEQLLRYKPSSEDEVLDLLVREREREREGGGERAHCGCHTDREGGGWVGGQAAYRILLTSLSQNVLDERLKHANSAVALAAIRLFLHLTADMPQLQEEVYQRIRSEGYIYNVYNYYTFNNNII